MISVRHLGLKPYEEVWKAMKDYTVERGESHSDELWLLEHPPVYTQGQAGKAEHILNPYDIRIIQSDRGGQVTYHGPGQMVAYVLMDIRRKNMGVRTLVCQLEATLIELLSHYGIKGRTRCGAPGVYVGDSKIASIGLRVKNGCTYHGIALNVAMDLTPFSGINPCGYAKMQMTQMSNYVSHINLKQVCDEFERIFLSTFEH